MSHSLYNIFFNKLHLSLLGINVVNTAPVWGVIKKNNLKKLI